MGKRGVALVSMPWGSVAEPSLGLGILKSVLEKAHVSCDIIDGPMEMLRFAKYETYEWVRNVWAANEFVFSSALQGAETPGQLNLLERILTDSQGCVAFEYLKETPTEESVEKLLRLRNEIVPEYLDSLLRDVDFSKYALVGFTCLFDQTTASLALAARLKEAFPELMLAFGGYALQRPVGPGLQAAFPQMDVVAYGDGEPTIVPLYHAAAGDLELSEVPNITYRGGDGLVQESVRTERIDLDDSPTPNYSDFFRSRERLREIHQVEVSVPEIPVESSRGCWWGQKSHCTFCGIDEDTLRYRKKSPETVRHQLDELYERHRHKAFRFSDYIIPPSHFEDLFPGLIADDAPYLLHSETKANLTEQQIGIASRAGVTCLQPGIESFSSPVLKLMGKGVTGIQNVFTIHSMMKHGIVSAYNILFGHPGESEEDYLELLKVVPTLAHFYPPASGIPIQWTRYSPLLEEASRFNASNEEVAPHWRYEIILSPEYRRSIGLSSTAPFAYYFESPYPKPEAPIAALQTALQHQIVRWTSGFFQDSFRLWTRTTETGFTLMDTRFDPGGERTDFGTTHERIRIALAGAVHSEKQVLASLDATGESSASIRNALNELVEARVVYREGRRYTWLAFDESFYSKGGAFTHLERVTEATLDGDEARERRKAGVT